MAAPQQPYFPAGCRLLSQLAYPTVLRLPSQPPFDVRIDALPAGVTQAALQRHFKPLGGTACQVVDGAAAGVAWGFVIFRSLDEVLQALKRPHDRVIDRHALECEFGEGGSSISSTGRAGLAAPPVPSSSVPHLSRMRRCLRAVGLEHILTRERDGWLAKRTWEDALPVDEQRRLCLARVIYHGPQFGLLDESTATMPVDAEIDLHRRLLEDWGITPVVLAQRAFAPGLYKHELHIGVDSAADGWELFSNERADAAAFTEQGRARPESSQ